MTIGNLTDTPISVLTDCFNEAFSDYILKFNATAEYLENRWNAAGWDRELSIGCYEEDQLVGFIIHAHSDKKKEVFNAATGVVPAARGQRLVEKMYDHILPVLRERGIKRASLEVIQENEKAVKAYKKAGFSILRSLASFKGKPELPLVDEHFDILQVQKPDWELYQKFWLQEPSWEMSIESIDRLLEVAYIFEAKFRERTVGYVIFHPVNGLIMQLGVDESFRKRKIGIQLLSKFPVDKEMKVVNVDFEAESTMAFYKNLKLDNYVNQYEMRLDF